MPLTICPGLDWQLGVGVWMGSGGVAEGGRGVGVRGGGEAVSVGALAALVGAGVGSFDGEQAKRAQEASRIRTGRRSSLGISHKKPFLKMNPAIFI